MMLHAAIEQLYNLCRETDGCYVLCDPQAGDQVAEWIAGLNPQTTASRFLRDPLFAESPQSAPALMRLPMSEFGLIEKLATHARQEAIDPHNPMRSVCAFIVSHLPPERLAPRLTQALDLRVDRQKIYFRYFDPRVFHHLPRLMPAERFGHLLRGIATWSYFLWDGSLAVRPIPETPPLTDDTPRLTSQEWQAFETIEHFNATQRLFAKQGLRFDPAQTIDLFAQVHAARSLGLPAPGDTAYYLACSSQSAQPLSQHPAWPDVVTLLKQDVPLADVLAQLCGVSLPRLHPPHKYEPNDPAP